MRNIRGHNVFLRGSICLGIAVVLSVAAAFVVKLQAASDLDTHGFDYEQVPLTEEEQAYQEKHPVVVVAADASWRPLEYARDSDGQYAGVIAEILTRLEQYSGFQIEYKIMDSYAEALKAVQSGEADMISGLADDAAMAEEYRVNLSKPYLMINSAIVSKNAQMELYHGGESRTIAVVDGDYANPKIAESIRNATLITCSSNEECLNLVKRGQADMAIIASYCAEYYMSVPKYSGLKSHTISDFGWKLAFGISTKEDPALLSIFDKSIDRMGDLDINEAVYEGIIHAAYDNDLIVFVYKHPLLVIGGLMVIVLTIGMLVLIIFIVKKRAQMRQLEDGTRLKMALARTHLCIWEIDLNTMCVTKIDNEDEKHGFYELRENIPESAIEKGYVHPDDIPLVRAAMKKVYRGEQDVQGCWRIKERSVCGKDTVYWWEQVLFHVVFDERNRPIKMIGISEDVTKDKEAQRDSLTLVYNRSSFEEKANMVLNERRNAHLQCAFLIMDLDGFKQINDTYGHGMGDRVLISVGATLNKTFRATDIVGRLGGDEFTAFMTSISKKEDAETKAKELVENICQIQEKDHYPFPISCSVGVVVATKGQEELAVLYKKADIALYEAKHAGKNGYRIYE
ncbi:MAG: diguanylate cyclase [Lachnospiraceae bacterium]|nr:diguanylate cyclase [Lachnospiraceae bacterium]